MMYLARRIRTSANTRIPQDGQMRAIPDPQHKIYKNLITKGTGVKAVECWIGIDFGRLNPDDPQKSKEIFSFEVFSFEGWRFLKCRYRTIVLTSFLLRPRDQ